MTAVSGCARTNQREPASDAGGDVRVAVRDGGVDVGTDAGTDASTCVDDRVGARPCSVVWAHGFGSRRSIVDVAVRDDDSVAALRQTYASSISSALAYDAVGAFVEVRTPSFILGRLLATPEGYAWASGYGNGTWAIGAAPVQVFAGGAEMGTPQVRQMIGSAEGPITLMGSWAGNIVRESGEVVLPGLRDAYYDGVLAWGHAGEIRWSFVTDRGPLLTSEQRLGADRSLLVSVSLPNGLEPTCVHEGLCLESNEGALVLLDADGSMRWVRRLSRDAGPSTVFALDRDPEGGIYALTESALIAFEADGTTRWRVPMPGRLFFTHLMWNNGSLLLSFGVPSETITLGRTRVRDCGATLIPRRQLVARIDTRTGDALDAWELDEGLLVTDLDARSDGSVVVGLASLEMGARLRRAVRGAQRLPCCGDGKLRSD